MTEAAPPTCTGTRCGGAMYATGWPLRVWRCEWCDRVPWTPPRMTILSRFGIRYLREDDPLFEDAIRAIEDSEP